MRPHAPIRLVLAALLATVCLGLGPGRAHAWKFAGGRWDPQRSAVLAKNDALEQKMKSFRPSKWRGLGGLKANAIEAVDDQHGSVVVRQRTHVGRYLRANRALQILAAQLGDPEMVPAAMTMTIDRSFATIPEGKEVMIMEHAGKSFDSADQATRSWRDAVGEETRLNGAIIDLLTQQRDRKLGNMLVSKAGKLRLIDPDRTFRARTNNPSYRPQFFPGGGKLAYRSKQRAFGDLPQQAQELIHDLANAGIDQISGFYGISDEEADVMRERARDIERDGLTKAADKFVRTLVLKPDR